MRLSLYIADQFESLASGKVLAVGLFTDRVVVMNVPADLPEPTATAPYATDLGLLVTLSDLPATTIAGVIRIQAPGAPPVVASMQFSGLTIAAGSSANIIAAMKPLLVPRAGAFTVEVEVGEEVLRADFEVRINRPHQPDGPRAAGAPANAEAAAKPRARRATRKKATPT